MVAFVVSGQVDIQPWYDNTTDDLWRACGFEGKPPYSRVYRRLRELNQCEDVLLDAIGKLVQKARSHDPRVGAHVHIDGTEDETHAALIHDCGPDDDCPYRVREGQRRRRAGGARRPARVPTSTARRDRQTENAEPAPDEIPDGETVIVERNGRLIKRIRQNGCWYRTNDLEAGIRAYMGPRGARRYWHGYYGQKSIDHFTGGVIFPGVYNASIMEFDQFPDIYEKTTRIIGAPPQTVIADKGHSIARVFELTTRNGTALITPWRAGNGQEQRHDHETHDRHGIPRCPHCGGPTVFKRFVQTGNPRIYFTCLLKSTDDCSREHSIACSEDWRALVPLWRTDPLYHELRQSMGTFEAQHDYWRDRYKVSADNLANRPKAVGIGWHKLRALTAGIVEWLRICHREGWLGSARRNNRQPSRRGQQTGILAAHELLRSRVQNGLMACYGPAAAALGLGSADPPSRRPRGQT